MKWRIFLLLILHFAFQSSIFSADRRFTIIRTFGNGHNVSVREVPDRFIIHENSSCNCKEFNALPLQFSSSNCECGCSKDRQPTFNFHNNAWKCTSDEQKFGFFGKCRPCFSFLFLVYHILVKKNHSSITTFL